jgi:hypothetical protein
MPSAFPGMDPYLEHPAHFPDLHDSTIAYTREFLQARLPAPYYSVIGSRIWVEPSRRSIGPDVEVRRQNGPAGGAGTPGGAAGVATATRTQPVVITLAAEEHRETSVEIYSRYGEGERLVTVIEVLSVANKTPGAHGRDLYLEKQSELLAGAVHLVEIDLLRGGTHATAVPRDLAEERAGPFDYHVCAHWYNRPRDYLVYPVRLEERLPEIAVPLLPEDPPVALDVQAVFERCYDTGPYRRRVRYGRDEVVPPLSAAQADWASRLLQERGLTGPAAS